MFHIVICSASRIYSDNLNAAIGAQYSFDFYMGGRVGK